VLPLEYERALEHSRARQKRATARIIGVDGEGQGRSPHRYLYLAASDEAGEAWDVACERNHPRGLSTQACLDMLLSLPRQALVVSFASLYDWTKVVQDMPDRMIWLLVHEEKRASIENGSVVYSPVVWSPAGDPDDPDPYMVNFMNRRLTVSRGHKYAPPRALVDMIEASGGTFVVPPDVLCHRCGQVKAAHRPPRRVTVWDVFRFFQQKFTASVADWKVGAPDGWDWGKDGKNWPPILRWLEEMKDERANFERLSWEEVQRYCRMECQLLAQTFRKVLTAHEDAGLELKSYYGVGSTARALLTRHEVKKFKADPPDAMLGAVACGFFGGRFENNCQGLVPGPVYAPDIASAYPYWLTFLPCLAHGQWELVDKWRCRRKIKQAALALVKWSIAPRAQPLDPEDPLAAWGLLPVRATDGTILFPLAAAGGWCWKEEYLAAKKLEPRLEAHEAWCFWPDCDHKPFEMMPHYYVQRLLLGKEGAGKVFKFGPNACYGVIAQSKGFSPPFQSWIWAGNITSGPRAQLLSSLFPEVTANRWDVLGFATDSFFHKDDVAARMPPPKSTPTGGYGKPPLGAWESKKYDKGVFFARPGVYFPPNLEDLEDEAAKKEIEKVRARGLGRKVLYQNTRAVMDAYRDGKKSLEIANIQRFVGAKTGISYGELSGVKRSERYGEWVDWPIEITFNPHPKRENRLPGGRLSAWQYQNVFSVPYKPALLTEEAKLIRLHELIAGEQPDTEFILE
jgi:hypothetical protein